MPNMEFVIYDKNLLKDIEKLAKAQGQNSSALKIKGPINFRPFLPVSKVPNPKAIQNDRLLKMKIRKKTDPTYSTMLAKIDTHFKNHENSGDTSQAAADVVWSNIQVEINRSGSKIQQDAHPVLSKYLEARNEGKAAKRKFKYNQAKKIIGVVGATAGVGVAIASAAASGGIAIAALGVAIYGLAKAGAELGRERHRNKKDLDATILSIRKTITVLNRDVKKWQNKHVTARTNVREVGAKAARELFATNIRSIKKLQQDIKLLRAKAQVEVLLASKAGAYANELHREAKELKVQCKKQENGIADLKKQMANSKSAPKKLKNLLQDVERSLNGTGKEVKKLQNFRDEIVKQAGFQRHRARYIVKTLVPALEDVAAEFKKDRSNIGWTSGFFKATGLALNLATQDWPSMAVAAPATAAQAQAKLDGIAGVITTAATGLKDLGNEIRKMNR